jgi:hypothetical protein
VRAICAHAAACEVVADMLDARSRNEDAYLEDILLEDLATETLANEQALARKDPLLAGAIALLVFAMVLAMVAVHETHGAHHEQPVRRPARHAS